jgi:hypothetical protein
MHRLIRYRIFLSGISHPSWQRLRPYPLLAGHTRHTTELDTPVEGTQHQIVDTEKNPDVEQSQSE